MKKMWALWVLALLAFKGEAQNVGIGITAPAYPLTVQGTNLGRGVTVKNGPIEVGIFNNGNVAFFQTWSEHNLNFATGNGGAKLTLNHSTGNVGINTPDPTAQLDINGTLRLRGNGAAAGKVLTSDAAGIATWSGSVAFSAQGAIQNNFDATTRLTTGKAPDNSRYQLFVNGVAQRGSDPDYGFMELSANVKLNAGDVVDVRYFYNDDSGVSITVANTVLLNNFSGFLIR